MEKRWINSVDVLVDDQGRVAVLLPAELVQNNRLKVDAQQDVEAITGLPACTLADLVQTINNNLYNLLDSQPWLQTIYYNLEMLRYEVWVLRNMLEDVYDAAQHALRTV